MSERHDLPIHASFLESVASPRVKELLVDAAELTLDSITDDEVLKQIPFVKTVMAVKGVRERFMLRKTYRFFARLNDMPQEDREAFIDKMNADPGQARRVGESFAVWLDRLDDEDKADLLSKVFEQYARGKIDFDRSARFAAVIDRGHTPYLRRMRDGYSVGDIRTHLLALGLMTIVFREGRSRGSDPVTVDLSDDGRIFMDYVVGEVPVKPRVTVRIHTPPKVRRPGA